MSPRRHFRQKPDCLFVPQSLHNIFITLAPLETMKADYVTSFLHRNPIGGDDEANKKNQIYLIGRRGFVYKYAPGNQSILVTSQFLAFDKHNKIFRFFLILFWLYRYFSNMLSPQLFAYPKIGPVTNFVYLFVLLFIFLVGVFVKLLFE